MFQPHPQLPNLMKNLIWEVFKKNLFNSKLFKKHKEVGFTKDMGKYTARKKQTILFF